jgi:tetratricopeptide (TPR) repeat protein
MADESNPERAEAQGSGPAAWTALGSASRDVADAFLHEQTLLARMQIEDLTREDALRHWSLRVRHVSDVLKLALELSVALIVLVIAAGIGAELWNAAHADGLVIEAFSVPPDLAQRGLTGEVVATKVLDRLNEFQAATTSMRAPSSYANNWGNDIKVQIPDTGVSIGELHRFLLNWLGHETHITGAVYRDGNALAVIARAGADPSAVIKGPESGLDDLIRKAVENVYRSTQPYRYAVWLQGQNRYDDAQAIFETLTHAKSATERAWAYVGLANQHPERGDVWSARGNLYRAVAEDPDQVLAWQDLSGNESTLQHDEAVLHAARMAVALADRGTTGGVDPDQIKTLSLVNGLAVALSLGDNGTVFALVQRLKALPDKNFVELVYGSELQACIGVHDFGCAGRVEAAMSPTTNDLVQINRDVNHAGMLSAFGHWRETFALLPHLTEDATRLGALAEVFRTRVLNPLAAQGKAETGDPRAAHALIDRTPTDCVLCVRVRGQVATWERRWGAASYWFDRATALAPSIPAIDADRAEMLLRKGDGGSAARAAAAAVRKGPHFPDGYELLGEALILENRSDFALTKFEETAKYAPNWGRLHLQWGKALLYVGKPEDAKKQFGIARGLDLSPTQRSDLAQLMKSHA